MAQKRDSKGRFTSGNGVAAFITAGVVAAGATGVTAASGGAASVESTAGQSLKSKSSSKDAARKGRNDEAWKRLGLKSLKKITKQELACTPYSFGQVRQFFLRTPCRSLHRRLVAIGDTAGNTIVVSVVWVRMPKAESATRLKELIDVDGSGDVSPLAGSVLKLNGIHFAGDHYASRRDGALIVIAETTSGGGRPRSEVLDDAADVAVEFPAP
jgi:hypothetical protein